MNLIDENGIAKLTFKNFIFCEVYGNQKRNVFEKFFFRYISPGTAVLFLIRRMLCSKSILRKKYYQWRLFRKYGVHVSRHAKIDIGFRLAHPIAICIGECQIGKNVTIHQGVTIGSKYPSKDPRTRETENNFPVIGSYCRIWANATVIGAVTLEWYTQVAAGAVLLTDTESCSIYAGVPAKKVKNIDRHVTGVW
ncbi:hypothetical protein FACS1894111_07610 [Clostridia bacterium]|nr:hypothetical protein FACS1894111_07610 [Clostridia bacterium]